LVEEKASIGDDLKKVVIICNIPQEEIIIEPKIQYYDIQQSVFSPLKAKDLTTIKQRDKKQVLESNLPPMAENRLKEMLEQLIFTNEDLA
jgi:hypothetical protein